MKVKILILLFFFLLGGIDPKEGNAFSFFCSKEEKNKKEELYSMEYSKPVFLDIEHLHRNRTVYVVLVNFNVREGLEKEIQEYLIEELRKIGMDVVADPKQGAYLIKLFLKRIDKGEVEVDVLIRERPEIKGLERKVKFYGSDLDSVDHLTTVRIKGKEGKEIMLFKKLVENLIIFFKIS
jgi:hypothetical protein